MTVFCGPIDVHIVGNAVALDLLIDAAHKANREGWAEVAEDGRALVIIHRKGAARLNEPRGNSENGRLRCWLGLHVWEGNVTPGPGSWRACAACGKYQEGAYDGMAALWHTTRPRNA